MKGFLVWVLLAAAAPALRAEPGGKDLPLLEPRWSFWGPALRYEADGRKIGDEELRSLFERAGEEESLRLLGRSRRLQRVHVLTFLGGAAGTFVLVRNASEGEEWRDGFLAAAGFGFLTELFRRGAVQAKLEAVNRYHRKIRERPLRKP